MQPILFLLALFWSTARGECRASVSPVLRVAAVWWPQASRQYTQVFGTEGTRAGSVAWTVALEARRRPCGGTPAPGAPGIPWEEGLEVYDPVAEALRVAEAEALAWIVE